MTVLLWIGSHSIVCLGAWWLGRGRRRGLDEVEFLETYCLGYDEGKAALIVNLYEAMPGLRRIDSPSSQRDPHRAK